ncbi:hypothetical protein AXF42_Ash017305 [Apostasia shenzhenica]|uniref:General transcription factor 3C polypeptide 5 n=1 Tax=Apostasia shenzhenica TaxID=1088818 RepID=A0A2I0BD97_9ASPA|nr:hypothetical protein AXF42_Ash017305 [Apostasia shenzhenica]
MALREDDGCSAAAATASTSTSTNPFPPPSAECILKEGTVSGVLPEAEVLAVHYPGYPTSTSRAIKTLGGLPRIAKAWSSAVQNLCGSQDINKDRRRFLKLKFRPDDPFCHPAFAEPRPSSGLLLRISRTRTAHRTATSGVPPLAEHLSVDVVSRVSLAYNFEGMADYQHVIAVHAAESRKKKRTLDLVNELYLGDNVKVDVDHGDLMMLVPPLFARKDKSENIVVLRIPEKFNWEDKLPNGTLEWKAHVAVAKLFEERPIWPRCSIHEHLVDDGVEVSDYLLRRTGYYFSHGPFGKFWIRKGYDPRGAPESRM